MTLVVDPVVGVISLLGDPFAPSSLLLVPASSRVPRVNTFAAKEAINRMLRGIRIPA